MLEVAASASYTFLLAHPLHEVMKNNVMYYHSLPEIKESYFKNLEEKPHQVSEHLCYNGEQRDGQFKVAKY